MEWLRSDQNGTGDHLIQKKGSRKPSLRLSLLVPPSKQIISPTFGPEFFETTTSWPNVLPADFFFFNFKAAGFLDITDIRQMPHWFPNVTKLIWKILPFRLFGHFLLHDYFVPILLAKEDGNRKPLYGRQFSIKHKWQISNAFSDQLKPEKLTLKKILPRNHHLLLSSAFKWLPRVKFAFHFAPFVRFEEIFVDRFAEWFVDPFLGAFSKSHMGMVKNHLSDPRNARKIWYLESSFTFHCTKILAVHGNRKKKNVLNEVVFPKLFFWHHGSESYLATVVEETL